MDKHEQNFLKDFLSIPNENTIFVEETNLKRYDRRKSNFERE